MSKFSPDTSNEMFQLAIQLVMHSNRNIFLTGKAGTGKTTFLKYIRENCPKQMAIVAPTGVAAINAGGVTMHSFFQLPFSPYIPEPFSGGSNLHSDEISNKHSLLSHLRFNSDKRKVLQELELLVIDEISMVRCDLLDAMDAVLRFVRQRPQSRFGGVQVLFIGDMLQLPPVAKEEEWKLLGQYYTSPYFFDSRVLQEEPPLYVEFNKIYRQKDEEFIDLLNQVRNNKLDNTGRTLLNTRIIRSFARQKDDGYIILTTHNYKAAEINARELAALPSVLFTYEADVQDDFSERSFPADRVLQLKIGAQVMFIRNDTAEKGKRYYNGKIGVISELTADKISVVCDGETIQVTKEKWENIRYSVNKTNRKIESEVLGSFTQYPIRLAWAITIHKSQGLTFEKAIIDAGESFAPGQVYVALSRCTSLEGMVLLSSIRESSLNTDTRIQAFSQQSAREDILQVELDKGRSDYQRSILLNCFDFGPVQASGNDLLEYLVKHATGFNSTSLNWTEEFLNKLRDLQDTAVKFHTQLTGLFNLEALENNSALQTRIREGSAYFLKQMLPLLSSMHNCTIVTDSMVHAKACNDSLREIFTQLTKKEFILKGFTTGFDPLHYHHRKNSFTLPPFPVNTYAGASDAKTETTHPELHQRLRKLRDSICSKKNTPIYMVAGTRTLQEMATYLPQDLNELGKISGFGKARIGQFGQQFLDIINDYCQEKDLSSMIHEISPKSERKERGATRRTKGDTQNTSFRLYREGKTVEEIARVRNLTIQTIESHLSRFVAHGQIPIEDLVNKKKVEEISKALKDFTGTSITEVKQGLGENFSYGEIRLVMASMGINPVENRKRKHSGIDEEFIPD